MRQYFKQLKQGGDTIVEVLIAAAVVSLVLTGAYSVANKSLQQIQASQERSEATKVGAQAMERLNTAVITDPVLTAASVPAPFCLTATAARVPAADSQCTAGLYRTEIRRESGSRNRFSVFVRWERVGGGPQQLIYSYYASSN